MLTGQPDRGSSSAEVPSAPVTPHWVKVTDEALPEAKLRVRGSSEAEPRGKEELRRETGVQKRESSLRGDLVSKACFTFAGVPSLCTESHFLQQF